MSDNNVSLSRPNPESSSRISSKGPFFTVLIPTMNRPELLKAAISTVLWQTFKDFELIVSDNSNDETSISRNREMVLKYANDPRVHYIYPPQWMNMPDHWEFASRHASGRYVVILSDRHVMRPSALQFLHTQINHLQEDGKVIAWYSGSEFNRSGIAVHLQPFTCTKEVFDSKQEIREFARCANWKFSLIWGNRLPRMLNSCYRFDVAHTIREKHGRLFMPISPDYTCAYLLLAYTERFTYIDRPLFMYHGNQGNGQNGLLYGVEKYASTLDNVDLFAGTPAPINTLTNSIVRDLLMIKNLVGARLSGVDLDLVGYFMCNYRELLLMEKLGSQVNVRALYAEWWKGIQMLTSNQQKLIKEHVNVLENQRASFTSLRRLSVRFGLAPLYHSIVCAMRYIRQRLAGKPVYADVLEAAMHTDYILTDAVGKVNR
jgi:glycosyltransferase involved in cell wall biosynthesis